MNVSALPGSLRVRVFALLALVTAILAGAAVPPRAIAADPPRIVQKDGHFALLVDGQPYLILGGQIHNSSAWPSELPEVWDSMAALHANTVEAPVYWEALEPQEGHLDFANVDAVVNGARAHNLHVVVLWFGTWKNGNMHYVPAWVKSNTTRFPRVIRRDGEPIDVLSALSPNTLNADKAAFVALMHHLNDIDGQQHTILLVQVENESGIIGSVRDFSADSNRKIAGQVPADLLAAAHKQPGTWNEVFGSDADEMFQVYHQARYINEIAAAGKKEFNVPCYINVWPDHPAAELPQRDVENPGIAYPSGGAVQKVVGLWRALAPSLDAIGPDIYTTDSKQYLSAMHAYVRPDNPLWIPETGNSDAFGKFFFYALGAGAIGFSPFGIDRPNGANPNFAAPAVHARNFSLIAPMDREIARMEFEGNVKTAVEETGKVSEELDFGDWQATVAFGFPQFDGRTPPGTKDARGVALVARLGPDEFLVTGFDSSVIFHLPRKQPWMRSEFVSVEEGVYQDGEWKPTRMLNGDETDRGLRFMEKPIVLRVKMGRF